MSLAFTLSARSCYQPGHAGLVSRCAFHPHQAIVACAIEGGRICIYERAKVADLVPIGQWKEVIFNPKTTYPAFCLEWSADGTRLAAGFSNGTVTVWDQNGHIILERRKHTGFVWNIRWNPVVLNIFATGSNDRSAMVWDADKKPSPLVQRFVVHDGDRVHDIVWISENRFASFSRDQNDGSIHVCQIGRETPIMTFIHGDSIDSISWNSRLNLLASISSTSRETIQFWSPNQMDPVKLFNRTQSEVTCIDWAPLAKETGILSSSTRLLVCGCLDGSLLVVNGETHERLEGHGVQVTEIAFAPNGKWLASIDRNGNLIIRLTKDWRKVYETRTETINHWQRALSWNGNGDKLAIASTSYQVFLLEISGPTQEYLI